VAALLDELGGDPLDRVRPVDSEHSAIWQCLVGERIGDVARLVLTASGGPLRGRDPSDLASVTAEEALAHPTWRMGPKITIDSATLVNKAFEVIEARWLYRLPYSKIDAVIHPQSVVHSLVEFTDGSYKAQLGLPDMRLPIQYALTHPERLPSPAATARPADWGTRLRAIDRCGLPAYAVTRAAAEAGGNRGAILNAADEVAVEAFLAGRIRFPAIADTIASAIDRWGAPEEPDLAGHCSTPRCGPHWRRDSPDGRHRTVGAFIAIPRRSRARPRAGAFITAKRAGITVESSGSASAADRIDRGTRRQPELDPARWLRSHARRGRGRRDPTAPRAASPGRGRPRHGGRVQSAPDLDPVGAPGWRSDELHPRRRCLLWAPRCRNR
jgi:hypothetical protein